MKAVFSYWNTTGNPLIASNWANPKHHVYSWILAVNQARKWYDKVELVTDSESKEVFESLKLPFTKITTELDELVSYNKRHWALGKIKAYSVQTEPFVHLDNDVILYKNSLQGIEHLPIVCQNLEKNSPYPTFDEYYRPMIDSLNAHNVIVSENWQLRSDNIEQIASPCMAIYLCNDLDFNKAYCKEVFDFVDNNKKLLRKADNKDFLPTDKKHLEYSVIIEQYLAGQVAFSRGVKFSELFKDSNFITSDELGYIHIWGAKNNEQSFVKHLNTIVKREYPKQYDLVEFMFK